MNLLPELGVGITYSSAIEPLLEARPDLFDALEIEPQTLWIETRDPTEPYRIPEGVLELVAQLPGRKLVHSVGAPVGGTVRPERVQLSLLRRVINELNSPWASEHLSFNSTPEFKTGFFLPSRQTPEGVEASIRAVGELQMALPVPVAVETGVSYLRPRADEMPDGSFVAAVAEGADCGILFDLHNIFTNALNGRQAVDDFLAPLPLERVWEVHIAGGFEMEGFWLDAHSGAVPEPLIEIARRVVPRLPNLKAIIFEIFPSFVPVVGLETVRAQIERLHELWELRHTGNTGHVGVGDALPAREVSTRSLPAGDYPSPAVWERALGALVIGRSPEDDVARELAADPGVAVVNRLLSEFRASMIVSVLRLTSRLIMLALGPDVFRAILGDFWSKTPPRQFAGSEAEAFASYLEALDLQVPQLAGILEFERAVLATMMDDEPRVVAFDSDPLPMLRALAEGHLPDSPGEPGRFEIEITPGGPIGSTAIGLQAGQQTLPFH